MELKRASKAAAEFLRDKNKSGSKDDGKYVPYFSSETELVAEIYRKLGEAVPTYPNSLFINYYKPKMKERNPPRVFPDMVFHERKGKRYAIEVKAVWFITTKTGGLYKRDKDRITRDYEKLRSKYKEFDNKIMLVGFLGEPEDYKEDKFYQSCSELIHKNSNIELITC
jgi:hypothetical protein